MANYKPSIHQITHQTINMYIDRHMLWSAETFGSGEHLEGLLRHIEKEVQEVRDADSKQERAGELVDVIILAIDAIYRLGYLPMDITSMLIEKQNINVERKYPKITDPNEPTEHIKE